MTNAAAVAAAFNDRINAHDLAGLAALMTDDHVFIDSANNAIVGKAECETAWAGFFAAFPDYRNLFEQIDACDAFVVITGHCACSDTRLAGPALWSAKIDTGRVAEWRVLEDTPANRATLDI